MKAAALVLLLGTGGALGADPDAGLETYALNMTSVRKMAQAFEAVDAAAKKNPALAAKLAADDEGAGDLATVLAKCEGDPALKPLFAAAGISVRDAVMTEAALAVAAAGAYVQQQTGKAPSGSPTAVTNVKFYQEHLAEIEPINARLRKLSVLGAGEDEGDEPTDKPDDD